MTVTRTSVLFALMLVAASALCGCTSQPTAPTVTVLGSWTGNEQGGFLAMVRGFEQKYGIRVDYTGTRDASAVLASDLKDGNPRTWRSWPRRASCARTRRPGRWLPSTLH